MTESGPAGGDERAAETERLAQSGGVGMTAGAPSTFEPEEDLAPPREPVIEDRHGDASPSIDQASPDVAEAVLRRQGRSTP
jgi:hypothetical protein